MSSLLSSALAHHPDLTAIAGENKPLVQHGLELISRRGRDAAEHFPTFESFIRHRNPSLLRFEHVGRDLIPVCEKVLSGELDRVMIWAPPRYLKSEVVSRLLPAYNLLKRPQEQVALISYGESLSLELSEAARDNFTGAGGVLKPGSEAKSRWGTLAAGRLWATGVSGRYLGKGYHLGIIDDPADPEQAISLAYQLRFERFWPQKFLSRQEPGARIVVMAQRLGIEDPVAFLLRRELGEGTELAPERWHILVLDEVKSSEPFGRWSGPRGLPDTCTLIDETDDREEGEILAPSRFSQEQVERIQAASGPFTTATQRQQRPLKPEGDFWQEGWFQIYDVLPAGAYNGGKDWDTAFTENVDNSASGYVETFRGPGPDDQFPVYVEKVDWDWKEFPELVEWMKSVPGPHHVEAKASGKSAVQVLKVHGIAADEVPVKGDKFTRASAVQPVVSAHRVYVNKSVVHHLLSGERQGLLRVTAEGLQLGQGGLDVNDMFVQALHRHLGLGVTKKKKKRGAFR